MNEKERAELEGLRRFKNGVETACKLAGNTEGRDLAIARHRLKNVSPEFLEGVDLVISALDAAHGGGRRFVEVHRLEDGVHLVAVRPGYQLTSESVAQLDNIRAFMGETSGETFAVLEMVKGDGVG